MKVSKTVGGYTRWVLLSVSVLVVTLAFESANAQDDNSGSIGNKVQSETISPDGVWRSDGQPTVREPTGSLNVDVDKAREISLDIDRLLAVLDTAPSDIPELAKSQRPLPASLYLPAPDGGFLEFEIRQTQILAPELAAKFPEIKTYKGVSVKKPDTTVTLDLTPSGFHAQILDPGNRWFIDPKFKSNTSVYLSYHLPRQSEATRHCLVESNEPQLAQRPSGQSSRSGDVLRTYRIAIATTGEYAQVSGGTAVSTLAAVTTTINRVVGIYEKELAISLQIIGDNDQIVFTSPSSDPFDGNSDPYVLINESQSVIDSIIGSGNYDIGHTLSTGAGGLAGLGVVCDSGYKAWGVTGSSSPSGDAFDIDFVAHEIGHQFGGSHTFNGSQGSCSSNRSASTAYEPGSGSTIQAYSGICGADNLQFFSDPIFHSESHAQMMAHVVLGSGSTCGIPTPLSNSIPVVDAGSDYTIPLATPFILSGTATDLDSGDVLTYMWEQRDLGPQASLEALDDGQIPLFRALTPSTDSFRYLPELSDVVGNVNDLTEKLPAVGRNMNWRLSVRDNKGGVESDDVQIVVEPGAGPFTVITPNGGEVVSGNYAVTWDVAATDVAPVLSPAVDIFLSVDGGSTFDVANPLAQGVPNDGEHTVVFPVTITASARLMIRGSNHIFYDVSDSDFIVSGTGTGLCPVGDQSDIFAEDWESGNTNQWAVNDIIPGNSWVNSASNPDQGLRHLHVDNPGTTTDSAFEWVSSQPISGSTYVFVKHQYNFEQYYDGGVIEYSSDGGINWLDISGLPVLLGSYPLALNFGSDNPLTGRSAFSGSSPGYIGTMVDLSSLSGSNVLLRFRVGTDSSVSAPGWDIDEVFLYQCTSIVARSCGGLPLTVDMALGQMPAVGNVSEVIGGTSGDDSINGYGGNDVICGFDGQDTLIGGPGSDTLYGGDSFGGDDSFNTLLGGTGADTLIGGPFDDQLYGQGGADYLESNNLTNSQDFLSGGSGNDVLRSYSVGGSTMRGNGNNDTLYGSASADNMTGDPGLDILYGNGGADIMSGGNGADILHGGRGDDELSGKGARDDLYGDRGNDILLGGNGNDDLDGGEGIDTCNGQGQETAGIGDTATNCETTSGVPRPASSISELSAR